MEKHGNTADDTVLDAGPGERPHQAPDGLEELFQVAIVRSDGQHGIAAIISYLRNPEPEEPRRVETKDLDA